MKKDNFFITTPIYYPSGQPHIGHAYSSILADVFARFARNDNCNVFFLTIYVWMIQKILTLIFLTTLRY